MKYNKTEYKKYVKEVGKREALPFKEWQEFQPVCDEAVGIADNILKTKTREEVKR